MTALEKAVNYLSIPADYQLPLGGLTWSPTLDALIRGETTLAINPEICLVLEGAAFRHRLPPFAFVLSLLDRMKSAGDGDVLYRAYQFERHEPAVSFRAGLLIAELCRELPGMASRPSVLELGVLLESNFRNSPDTDPGKAERPPLGPVEFRKRIDEQLQRYSETELRHWLRHGDAPSPAGPRLAAAINNTESQQTLLSTCFQTNPRLVGALTIHPTMESALTMPPRIRSERIVPQGGYQDVTTRGDPERLLPSQFALDTDDFIRRFASNELLYFEREFPHTPQRPERLLILDQGVRSWGGVRLALTAGLITFLKLDQRLFGTLKIFLTSRLEPIELAEFSAEKLSGFLEACDFSAHPAACLQRAIQSIDDATRLRDIILLTHPRNLAEPAVIQSLQQLRPSDRFFALTVADSGETELSEWRRSGFAPLRQFRVDLVAAENAEPNAVDSTAAIVSPKPWTGAVEPIPFPFRLGGIVDAASILSFDSSSEHLIVGSDAGIIEKVDLAKSLVEVLPRAFYKGAVLQSIRNILPTNDGIVVFGTLKLTLRQSAAVQTILSTDPILYSSASTPAPQVTYLCVAAHYDFARRIVRVHELIASDQGIQDYSRWPSAVKVYYPDLHCIAILWRDAADMHQTIAIDLATDDRFQNDSPTPNSFVENMRAFQAWERKRATQSVHRLNIYQVAIDKTKFVKAPFLEIAGTRIKLHDWEGGPVEFEPMLDGLRLLEGKSIWDGLLSGNLLAIQLTKRPQSWIYLFQLPEGRLLHEIPWTTARSNFMLSPSAARIALCQGTWNLEVRPIPDGPSLPIKRAKLHDQFTLEFESQPFHLAIGIGKDLHSFKLDRDSLRYQLLRQRLQTQARQAVPELPVPLGYDVGRFRLHNVLRCNEFSVVVDRLGQILLLNAAGEIVAIFLVRRKQAAVWIPEGVFWGWRHLIGGAAHPDAEKRIGAAILAAMEGR